MEMRGWCGICGVGGVVRLGVGAEVGDFWKCGIFRGGTVFVSGRRVFSGFFRLGCFV